MASKKKIMKNLKPLAVIAHKNLIKEEQSDIDMVTLRLINIQYDYTLGPVSKTIDRSLAFPYDRSGDMLFVEPSSVNLMI